MSIIRSLRTSKPGIKLLNLFKFPILLSDLELCCMSHVSSTGFRHVVNFCKGGTTCQASSWFLPMMCGLHLLDACDPELDVDAGTWL